MRSAVWSIARAARPVGARSALRVQAPPAVAALHTSAPRRDEEKIRKLLGKEALDKCHEPRAAYVACAHGVC